MRKKENSTFKKLAKLGTDIDYGKVSPGTTQIKLRRTTRKYSFYLDIIIFPASFCTMF